MKSKSHTIQLMKPQLRHRITVPLILCIFPLAFGSCSGESVVTESYFALGTVCSISLHTGGSQDLLMEAGELIRETEDRMSLSVEGSEVVRVNRGAGERPVAVSEETLTVIEKGLEISAAGEGAFDISIGPVVALWGIGTDHAAVPSPQELSSALERVDFRDVRTDSEAGTVYLMRAGMGLDLGGIAKGWAADKVKTFLTAEGVTSGLIDFGGNILTIGSKPNGESWRIGIQHPDSRRGTYIGVLLVTDKAVVTSGKYERFFIHEEVRYHHIMDARTGYPVENGIASVSIVAPDSITADGMSTAVFSLGLERGSALIDQTPGVDCIIIMENADVYVSANLVEEFNISDDTFTVAGVLSGRI